MYNITIKQQHTGINMKKNPTIADLKLSVKSNLQDLYDRSTPEVQTTIDRLTGDIERMLPEWSFGKADTTDLEWRAAKRKGGDEFTVVLGSKSGNPISDNFFGGQKSARVSKLYPAINGFNPFEPEVEYDFPCP